MVVLLFRLVAYVLAALACAATFSLVRHRFRQRGLHKIPGPPSASPIWGHWRHFFNPYATSFHEELQRTYGSVSRTYGFLWDVQLIVTDPKACNNIFIKDPTIFEETEVVLNTTMQSFGPGLLGTSGTHHRRQRKLLNPAFSVNHLRNMTPIFHGVARQLREGLELIVANGEQEINVADWMNKFSLEVIGQAGLGYSFGTFDGKNNEYCKALKEWIPATSSLLALASLFPYIYKTFNPKFLKLVGRMVPWPKLNHLLDLAETLNAEAKRVYETKKKLLELGDDATVKQVGEGKDIISILMRASAAESEDNRLSEDELIAQMAVFVLAATDTTSSALSRIVHLLALHPDVQDKLRKELKEACEDNEEPTHDQLAPLPFLEAVCRETLRLYPPVPGAMRTARSDVILPLSSPIHDVDGREMHEIFVPQNTNVYAHIFNFNRDPSIWGPDAAEWKPERWLEPLPESVPKANIQAIYANTLTFIGGPRACIGFKFSQLEIKVALSQIIPAFRVAPTKAEVVWRWGALLSPSVKGSVELFSPKLPIMISRA